jgi:5'-nucleotidase
VLLRAFETVVAGNQPDANVSGVEIWYDPSKPNGSRVRRAKLSDGRQVEKGRTYTLAVSDFMAEGGSDFSMLIGAPREDSGNTDLEALVSYVSRLPRPIEVPDTPRLHPEK